MSDPVSRRTWRGRGVARAAIVLACVASLASSANAAPPTTGHPPPAQPSATAMKPGVARRDGRIDINTASRAELKTLPGIADEEARKIVAGRPWLTKADLVTKNVVPEGIYLAIKNRIVAAQPARAR